MVGKLSARRYSLPVLVLALMAMLLMMLPGVADAKKHKGEYAKGSGIDGLGESFSFNVKAKDKDPSTNAATGTFSASNSAGDSIKVTVVCLRTKTDADGSRLANFAGTITDSTDPGVIGRPAGFEVTDSTTGDKLDPASTTACHDPVGATTAITSGSIVVHPLPAS